MPLKSHLRTMISALHLTPTLPRSLLSCVHADIMCSELSKGRVRRRPSCGRMLVLPLFAGLPAEYQRSVFEAAPAGARKVILSTNVAETSVTIPGVAFVVDSGMEKIRLYEHATGQEALVVVPCSRSYAKQRAGRAGRERPGKVFRLFTEDAVCAQTSYPSVSLAEADPLDSMTASWRRSKHRRCSDVTSPRWYCS